MCMCVGCACVSMYACVRVRLWRACVCVCGVRVCACGVRLCECVCVHEIIHILATYQSLLAGVLCTSDTAEPRASIHN